jgi:hypothetical protein
MVALQFLKMRKLAHERHSADRQKVLPPTSIVATIKEFKVYSILLFNSTTQYTLFARKDKLASLARFSLSASIKGRSIQISPCQGTVFRSFHANTKLDSSVFTSITYADLSSVGSGCN